MESEQEADVATAIAYADLLSPDQQEKFEQQLIALAEKEDLSLELVGNDSNRWFADLQEARDWLRALAQGVQKSSGGGGQIRVVDSNGAELLEGDSVTVIKDLKVKGGSSDLKRGTLIKKIHLTSDPELIECKVGGSTLVLRTEFLKKS